MAPGPLVSNNYYNKHIAPVRNMSLPDQIKCSRCDYVKPKSSYSKVKLADLQMHMGKTRNFDAAKTAHVPCVNCTGGQKVETKCGDCGMWKGKDKFNKTQWKKDNEEAVCEKCNEGEMRRGYEPPTSGDDEGDGNDESGSGEDSNPLSDNDNGFSLGGGMSVNGSGSTYAGSSTGGVPLASTNGSSVASFNSSIINGSRRVGSASTAQTSTGGSKWAKVPSGKSKPLKKEEAISDDDRQVDSSSNSSSD